LESNWGSGIKSASPLLQKLNNVRLVKLVKVKICKVYYKKSQVGRDPIKFHAVQPKGIGTDIKATVKLDPVLRQKRHKDLHKAMMGHELYEIKDWGQGCDKAHHHAKRKEPKLTRKIGGVSGFWQEISRREKRRR
jgi:hypothetical protein